MYNVKYPTQHHIIARSKSKALSSNNNNNKIQSVSSIINTSSDDESGSDSDDIDIKEGDNDGDYEDNIAPTIEPTVDTIEDISSGRFIMYNYELLSDSYENINKYKCSKDECEDASGYHIKFENTAKWSVGTSKVIGLNCTNCKDKCNKCDTIVTTPWIEWTDDSEVILDVQKEYGRPKDNCYAISNILLQFCCILTGNINGLSVMFCSMFDIKSMCNDTRNKVNKLVSTILVLLGEESMRKHLATLVYAIRAKYQRALGLSLDEAWLNVAGRNASVAYGALIDVIFGKVIKIEVMSRLKGDCDLNSASGITPQTSGSEIGWKVAETLIDEGVKIALDLRNSYDIDIPLEFITDNDLDYEPKFEEIKKTLELDVYKRDDVNHALGKIYADAPKIKELIRIMIFKDWEAKIEACNSNAERKKLKDERDKLVKRAQNNCGPTTITYIFSQSKFIVTVEHKEDLEPKHFVQMLYHTFNGKDHRTCPPWCKARDEDGNWVEHKTTLPRGTYQDRHNSLAAKYALAALISVFKKRFDHENCVRLRNVPRTNTSENLHSVVSGMTNKHSRPPRLHIAKGVCHAGVIIKNEGRGNLYKSFCNKLGMNIGESQMTQFITVQNKQKYHSQYQKQTDVKISRAKSSKSWKDWNARQQKFNNKTVYKTDSNITNRNKRKKKKEPETSYIDINKIDNPTDIYDMIDKEKDEAMGNNIDNGTDNNSVDDIDISMDRNHNNKRKAITVPKQRKRRRPLRSKKRHDPA